jgi:3'(2'), 5'-bisphosphate nucleotidase
MWGETTVPDIDKSLIDRLTTLASQAAAAVLAIPRSALAVESKADNSPVTAADKASDSIICEGLSRLLPGVPVVSEESKNQPTSVRSSASFVLVDPLDGTKEFLANRNEFTINLGLIIDGRPVAGIVGAPALGLVFRGLVGSGAQRLKLVAGAPSELATEIAPISARSSPSDGLVATLSRSHLESATEAFLKRLPIVSRLPCGSALKFCRVAEGQADIYPRLAPTSEWDVAAGHALLVAAGGDVTTPAGDTIIYGRADARFLIPAFVAWGRRGPT